ncbi:related to NUT2 - subunit of the RNA polymerase II mediator complex [Melanopsichium pennsylvanicum]|uniref:Mediator of RNA polymerase II transcription subunit 10 n=2 Tax=Melanopsichium pennsylvanicum TaxID=63383 RepID=A0AAJ4XKU0_9BASI|nr:conserved hypothetical protein [Melanopsichium pennsylvanicum 4]SNX82943.1 related to NUT2 - subunit of the RNA polymerase II mediator complex [Melanopsichium pennsylvanicum]
MSSVGGRRTRQITPTSPSPSPEPLPGTDGSTSKASQTTFEKPPPSIPIDFSSNPESNDPTAAVRANLETRTRSVVDLLYQIAVCSADVQEDSQHLVAAKVNECIKALAALDATKDELHRAHMMVPQDVLEMLDSGKNPDIHTRNFVNRLASENQYSFGQHRAVESYKSRLDAALDSAFPQLKSVRGDAGDAPK